MADQQKPDAPPSYAMATGSSTSSKPTNLEVPGARNGIPPINRRSMEDEQRPLPEGWIRQFDPSEEHQFFVDTKADPPRSIWHHPYDDEQYLSTLSSEERERIQEEERLRMGDHPPVTPTSIKGSEKIGSQSTGASYFPEELPPRASVSGSTASKGKSSFGDRLKEKVTGMSKEERAKERQVREQQEREYYQAHQRFRQCVQQAQMTGQPQFFAKDRDGKEIYIEPPNMGGYGPYGGGYGGYGQNPGYGYNPYTSGPYANPNARFIRPGGPYSRPGGPGYGGGYGLPIAGGLLGGMLLGGLLF